jgi:hypothetical protein
MHEYLVKTVKVGDSIVVALPRKLLAAEQVSEGMTLKITVQKCQKSTVKEKGDSCEEDPWRQLE